DDRLGRPPASESRPVVESIWDHWTGGVSRQGERLRRELDAARRAFGAWRACGAVLGAGEVGIWPRPPGVFRGRGRSFLPRLTSTCAMAAHVIAAHRPRIIISADVNDPRTRIFCLMARAAGVPSIDVQFGMFAPETVEWRFLAADILAASGEGTYDM